MIMLPNKLGPAKRLLLLIKSIESNLQALTSNADFCDNDLLKVVSVPDKEQNVTISEVVNSSQSKELEVGECAGVIGDDHSIFTTPVKTGTSIDPDKHIASGEAAWSVISPSCSETVSNVKIAIKDCLPRYSLSIQTLLNTGNILQEWDKFVEETAYHMLSACRFDTRDMYNELGRTLHQMYPCIGFSGSQPWSHFTSKLSQKIRNIRWRRAKRSRDASSPKHTETPRKRKAPRMLLDIDSHVQDPASDVLDVEAAMDMMTVELEKPLKEQDSALIGKAMRDTFKCRREFIQSIEDGNIKAITDKYPVLKLAEFTDSDLDTSEHQEECEVLILLKKVQSKIKFLVKQKKEMDLFTEVDVTNADLETKNKTPPRLVVIKNSNGTVNNCYIVGDGLEIEAGKSIKYATELLLICYYVYDLSYPKCYQLLGFLQTVLFQDRSPFHRSTRFLKFEKLYFMS